MSETLLNPLDYRGQDGNRIYEPHKLCEQCRRFLSEVKKAKVFERHAEGEDLKHRYNEHHPNIIELNKSAWDGCHFCALLRSQINERHWNHAYEETAVRNRSYELIIEQSQWKTGVNSRLNIRLDRVPDHDDYSEIADIRIGQDPELGDSVDKSYSFAASQLSASTGSNATFELAKHWLSNCQTHELCSEHGDGPETLPTRLLDVTPSEDRSTIRLHISSHSDIGVKYLALSHCWGGANVLTLRTDNFNELTRSIHISSLPLTFRDAVVVTRALGFRYLWIDALCIIQNSIDDWQHESLCMGSVYSYASCTIAALSAKNSLEGFLRPRFPLKNYACSFTSSDNNDSAPFFITSDRARAELTFELGLGQGKPAALNTRAWVVQERMLSPRTLFFCRDTVYWECRTLQRSELSPDRSIELGDGETGSVQPKKCYQTLRAQHSPDKGNKEELLRFLLAWKEFLALYTSGRLTKKTDRLYAASGITNTIRIVTGMTEYFGLWVDFLKYEILWCSLIPYYESWNDYSVRETGIAPSWSFASHDAPIYRSFDTQMLKEEAKWYAQNIRLSATSISNARSLDTGLLFESPLLCRTDVTFKSLFYGFGLEFEGGMLVDYFPDYGPVGLPENKPIFFALIACAVTEDVGLVLTLERSDIYHRIGLFRCDPGTLFTDTSVLQEVRIQ